MREAQKKSQIRKFFRLNRWLVKHNIYLGVITIIITRRFWDRLSQKRSQQESPSTAARWPNTSTYRQSPHQWKCLCASWGRPAPWATPKMSRWWSIWEMSLYFLGKCENISQKKGDTMKKPFFLMIFTFFLFFFLFTTPCPKAERGKPATDRRSFFKGQNFLVIGCFTINFISFWSVESRHSKNHAPSPPQCIR